VKRGVKRCGGGLALFLLAVCAGFVSLSGGASGYAYGNPSQWESPPAFTVTAPEPGPSRPEFDFPGANPPESPLSESNPGMSGAPSDAAPAGDGTEQATILPSPSPTPIPTPDPRPVTAAVGGDVLLLGRIGNHIARGEYEAVLSPDLAELMRSSDVCLVNLETSVSTRGAPIEDKEYAFRSAPEHLDFLTRWLGVDAVSIANNHTLDYGFDAFSDTIDHLDSYGIGHIGGGSDIIAAASPYIAEQSGIRVAFFAANQILPYTDWMAGTGSPGQLITRDAKNLGALGAAIEEARQTCDYIAVYMHWGLELEKTPYARQTSVARALIDAGADVVIGAHPHVVQSFEFYNVKPIIYSTGNFLFNANHPETVVILLDFKPAGGGVGVRALPCRVSGALTYALEGDEARQLLDKWEGISDGVVFADDGLMSPSATAST
jgi:poly-gamma-glutamate synthesis protein (capsule biosynthesis protein)